MINLTHYTEYSVFFIGLLLFIQNRMTKKVIYNHIYNFYILIVMLIIIITVILDFSKSILFNDLVTKKQRRVNNEKK